MRRTVHWGPQYAMDSTLGRKGIKSSARSSLGGALHIPQEGQQSFMAVWIKLIKRTKLPDITVVLTDFVVIAHSFSAQSQKSILTKVNAGQFLAIYVFCFRNLL